MELDAGIHVDAITCSICDKNENRTSVATFLFHSLSKTKIVSAPPPRTRTDVSPPLTSTERSSRDEIGISI